MGLTDFLKKLFGWSADSSADETTSTPAGPWLEVLEGADQGARFQITPKKQLVGRHNQADLLLHDPQGRLRVSRAHATIWAAGNEVRIADNQATFGVVVNGERITDEAALQDGDLILLGKVKLRYHAPSKEWRASPAASAPEPEQTPRRATQVKPRDPPRAEAVAAAPQTARKTRVKPRRGD